MPGDERMTDLLERIVAPDEPGGHGDKTFYPKKITTPEQQAYFRQHAIDRALERYGVELSLLDYELLNLSIVRGQATFIARQDSRRKFFLVDHPGTKMKAVYDNVHHQIITFVAPE